MSCLLSANVLAQTANFGIGYSSMPGNLGEKNSDHGVAIRLGVEILGGRHLGWGVGAGLDFLNEDRRQYTTNCFLPDGSTGPCHFDSSGQDTGISLGTVLRVYPGSRKVRSYGVFGFGLLRNSSHQTQMAVDDAGNSLTNFDGDFSYNEEAIQIHLGAGVTTSLGSLPFGVYVESRASRLFYGYSGGLSASWNPTMVVGIRTGRGS